MFREPAGSQEGPTVQAVNTMQAVNLTAEFAGFQDYWNPRIAGELNGQHVKLVKFQGEFVWHHHEQEDELFLVVEGEFTMQYRDGNGPVRELAVKAGEFVIVPRGQQHRPVAEHEVHVLLFEPAGTLNTGNVRTEHTVDRPLTIGREANE